MSSIRGELFGKNKFVQIPLDNKERVETILEDEISFNRTDDNFCYIVYRPVTNPSLDSYKKMGVAFNYFPNKLSEAVVTVRFSSGGKLVEEAYPVSDFIINPFELSEDIDEAKAKAIRLVKFVDRGWENQVENGNLYSVSKLMED